MKAIGIRAESRCVNWALVDGSAARPNIVTSGVFKAPKTFSESKALRWYRERIQQILTEYSPLALAVRTSETRLPRKPGQAALDSMFGRARIEGVVLEAGEAAGIQVSSGAMQEIRTGLGARSAKAYLDQDDFRGADWSNIRNIKCREAAMIAAAVLKE